MSLKARADSGRSWDALLRDLRWSLDPVSFFEEALQFEADPHQKKLLRSRSRRQLLNCTRKWGKSTTTAAAVLHECSYVENSKVVIIAPSQRQSSLLLARIEELTGRVPGFRCESLKGEDPGLRFPCGQVIALPGNEATVRGLEGTTWLIIDEAARVSDELFYAVRPFLANTNGRMSLLSTPFGKRGFFYEEHQSGRWEVLRVPAVECPRISPEFLAEERIILPAAWFKQEYGCEFTSTDESVFDHDMIVGSLTSEIEPLCL